MNRRQKSSLLWGLIGAMLFGVLTQGYLLAIGSLPIGWLGMIAIGLLVGGSVTSVAYAVEPRVAKAGR